MYFHSKSDGASRRWLRYFKMIRIDEQVQLILFTAFDVRAIPKENLNETDERKNHTAMLDFGDSMNSFITTSVALLGAALGRGGCDLKAACLAATYIPNIQGRDIAVL